MSTDCALQVSDIQEILRDTSHNGYPVVRDSSAGQICLGLVSRAHMLVLLQRLIDRYNAGGSSSSLANGSAAPAGPEQPRQQHQQPLLGREVRQRVTDSFCTITVWYSPFVVFSTAASHFLCKEHRSISNTAELQLTHHAYCCNIPLLSTSTALVSGVYHEAILY